MAAQGEPPGSIRPTPGQLQTNGAAMRNQRFSWQETPLDVQRSTFQQFSSPTNSTIDESPISPRDGYRPFPDIPQPQGASQYPVEKPTVDRTASPYHLSGPHGTHPAYFAPVVEEPTQRQPRPQAPAAPQPKPAATTNSEKGREAVRSSPPPAQSDAYPRYPKDGTEIIKADIDKSTPVYNPSSLAGPNATLENHRPGQVAHPNAAVEPDWKHGLCELDTLCCVGLCCPCILYGKTQYRISRKTQKEDPTNLLEYESCNSSCGLMAFACGIQGILTTIQRARVRKLYQIKGDFGSDCLKSFCCCCCVLMQDEREVRDREELIRRHAGPASIAYTSPPTMMYTPPPR